MGRIALVFHVSFEADTSPPNIVEAHCIFDSYSTSLGDLVESMDRVRRFQLLSPSPKLHPRNVFQYYRGLDIHPSDTQLEYINPEI